MFDSPPRPLRSTFSFDLPFHPALSSTDGSEAIPFSRSSSGVSRVPLVVLVAIGRASLCRAVR